MALAPGAGLPREAGEQRLDWPVGVLGRALRDPSSSFFPAPPAARVLSGRLDRSAQDLLLDALAALFRDHNLAAYRPRSGGEGRGGLTIAALNVTGGAPTIRQNRSSANSSAGAPAGPALCVVWCTSEARGWGAATPVCPRKGLGDGQGVWNLASPAAHGLPDGLLLRRYRRAAGLQDHSLLGDLYAGRRVDRCRQRERAGEPRLEVVKLLEAGTELPF